MRPLLFALCAILCVSAPASAQDTFLGKSTAEWTTQLQNGADVKTRRGAAFALGKLGRRAQDSLGNMKVACENEKDAKVREATVFAMGEIIREIGGGKNDILENLFIAALNDNDPHLRRSGAFALGCMASKTETARKALEAAIGDREAMVKQNAAWAIAQFGAAALPALQRALRDKDSLVKREAAGALLQVSDGDKVHELMADLLPLCRDANSEVRRAGLNVLVRVVDPTDKAAIPVLKDALKDRDVENQRNAALALTNIGGDESAPALPVLLEAAKNGDDELRRQAVVAIRNIGPAAAPAVPDLMRFLTNKTDPKLREYAALALGGVGKASEPAVGLLAEKIKDIKEDRDVRKECAMALARMGPVASARDFVPTLLDILGDASQDPLVRERVMWSLRVHGGNLRDMPGTKDVFTRILKERLNNDNKMLRYDCAYMLGMIWQAQAPDAALAVLADFLHDRDIKIFYKTVSGAGGTSTETIAGGASVKEQGKGDGRVMAADALHAIGPTRYAANAGIMKQLRQLANDAATDPPLRKKVVELVKTAK